MHSFITPTLSRAAAAVAACLGALAAAPLHAQTRVETPGANAPALPPGVSAMPSPAPAPIAPAAITPVSSPDSKPVPPPPAAPAPSPAPAAEAAPTPAAEPAPAEPAAEPAPAADRGRVEAGASGAHLTDGNRSWRDAYVRGHYSLQPGSVLHWELASQGHFGQRGTLGALSFTQDLSPLWYLMGGVSAGSADFQNRYRFDVGVYRKWGPTQQWVTGLALMRAASGDRIHKDTALTASAAYYSGQRWVAEGGLKLNRSNPGSVNSHRVFGALTLGAEKQHYLVLRLDHGKEAYLPAGAVVAGSQPQVRFSSTEATVQWRHWISPQMGYVLGVQGYRNPYYKRMGANVGLFYDF